METYDFEITDDIIKSFSHVMKLYYDSHNEFGLIKSPVRLANRQRGIKSKLKLRINELINVGILKRTTHSSKGSGKWFYVYEYTGPEPNIQRAKYFLDQIKKNRYIDKNNVFIAKDQEYNENISKNTIVEDDEKLNNNYDSKHTYDDTDHKLFPRVVMYLPTGQIALNVGLSRIETVRGIDYLAYVLELKSGLIIRAFPEQVKILYK